MIDRRSREETVDEKLSRLRSLLHINRDKLDDEVAEHAEHYERVAELHVLAVSEYDAIKQELDDVIAEESVAVRQSEDKMTETAIKQLVKDKPKVQKLSRELLDAKLLVDKCSVLKESFGQRSYMMRELVGLYISRRLSSNAHSAKEDLQSYSSGRVREERARDIRHR